MIMSACFFGAATVFTSLPVNSDPVLDLAFALDQSFSARIGPIPSFSRNSTGTRINSSGLLETVTFNVPRINYDPVSLDCMGLLMEQGQTNFCVRTEEFRQGSWTKDGVTVYTNVIAAPTGALVAERLVFSGADKSISQLVLTGVSVGSLYTFSIWLKGTAGETINLGFTSGDNETVVLNSTWTRYSVSGILVTNRIYVGTLFGSTALEIHIFGAQLEAGPVATSYIPSLASTATSRSSDMCFIEGGDFSTLWGFSAGGIVIEASRLSEVTSSFSGGMPHAISANDGTVSNAIQIIGSQSLGGEVLESVVNDVVSVQLVSPPLIAAQTQFKVATRYGTNNFAISVNGDPVVSSNTGSVASPSRLDIGFNSTQSSRSLNGHIQRLRIYNTALADTTLRDLSS